MMPQWARESGARKLAVGVNPLDVIVLRRRTLTLRDPLRGWINQRAQRPVSDTSEDELSVWSVTMSPKRYWRLDPARMSLSRHLEGERRLEGPCELLSNRSLSGILLAA